MSESPLQSRSVNMASTSAVDQTGEVVEKVLRRAEVSRMAQKLQNRLALASFKTRYGWEAFDMDTLEPKIDIELQRRRPGSSSDTVSESPSSSISSSTTAGTESYGAQSSPLTAPIFSDDLPPRSGSSAGGFRKRKYDATSYGSTMDPKRARSFSLAAQSASKPRRQRPITTAPNHNNPNGNYAPTVQPTLPFSNENIPPQVTARPFGDSDDDEDTSTFPKSTRIHSSPPRTPPPTRTRSGHQQHIRQTNFANLATRTPETGAEDAGLLLHLATSPSPANPGVKARLFPPSTPPSKNLALPSSMMNTPGGLGVNTPSPAFNFADFVNITPSPAQAAWTNSHARTPAAAAAAAAAAKTPLATREARRRLNFDSLGPPIHSPAGQAKRAMELGGELNA